MKCQKVSTNIKREKNDIGLNLCLSMNRVKYNFTIARDYYHEDGDLTYQVIDVVFVLKLLLSF